MSSLQGRIALVTGASKGIGRAISLALATRGARLILVARGEEALEATAETCRAAGSPHVLTIAADVADYKDLDRIVMTSVRECDGFDILVNNAGIGSVKPITEVSDEEFDHTMAVNVRAPYMLTQAAVKIMRRRKRGQIVTIGSGLSYFGRADWSLYAATKFAVRGMTESVRHEVARENIKVGLVSPGYTETHFFDQEAGERSFKGALQPEDVAHAVLSMIEQPQTSDIKEITVRGPMSP